MSTIDFERKLLEYLPTSFLKDIYPRIMRRLAEYGWNRNTSLANTNYGFKMNVDRLDSVKWFVYYFNEFEPQISRAWKNLLEPGDVVLDIGGNVGYHALLAATAVGKEGLVISFEPSQYIFDQLNKNIEMNGFSQIQTKKNAISNEAGVVNFYFGGENNQGNSSLISNGKNDKIEQVECITFEEVGKLTNLGKVNLIKIDVEGAEPLVLESLSKVIPELNPDVVIFLEISPENTSKAEEILKPFKDAGFEMRLITNEYNTKFYRDSNKVEFKPFQITPNEIHDVVMSKNQAQFQKMQA